MTPNPNQPPLPERETAEMILNGKEPPWPLLASLAKAYNRTSLELDRLRAQPCQPPGCPEGMRVVGLVKKHRMLGMNMSMEYIEAELAPISGEEKYEK